MFSITGREVLHVEMHCSIFAWYEEDNGCVASGSIPWSTFQVNVIVLAKNIVFIKTNQMQYFDEI